MATFKECRDWLLLLYADNCISDEEFILLYDSFQSTNPDFNYEQYPAFQLDNIEEAECKAEFRVEKRDLPRLVEALQLPTTFKCEQRSTCGAMEGLCMLLKRLAYPCRYSDMIPRFGRSVSVISLITNDVIGKIYNTHSHRITEWNNLLLSPLDLECYANAIARQGAALNNCFGFIDGTVRAITRPGQRQRVAYNDHKRVHALKFQSLALPNGLIGNIYGPVGK